MAVTTRTYVQSPIRRSLRTVEPMLRHSVPQLMQQIQLHVAYTVHASDYVRGELLARVGIRFST